MISGEVPEFHGLLENKRDVARERVAPKEYIEDEKQILEMTQTEVFKEFTMEVSR